MSAETTAATRPAHPDQGLRSAGRAPAMGLSPVRGRRRPWLMALGFLLASVGALTVVWLVGAAGQRVEILVVRQDLAPGQQLADGDLGIARVSVDPGVAVVPAADRAQVIGLFAATELRPGMLLAPAMVRSERGPNPGQSLVPVAVASERMPAGGLRAGDRILVVDAGDAASAEAPSRTYPATVERVGATDVNGVTVVDVVTTIGDAPRVAVASANGRVALVLQPSGS